MSRLLRRESMLLVICCVELIFAAAAPAAEKNPAKYASVKIADVPHVRQEPDFCGEACAQMWLNKLGKKLDQDFVFNQSGLDPALGRGCYTADLVRALVAIGFHVGPVWQTVPLDEKWNRFLLVAESVRIPSLNQWQPSSHELGYGSRYHRTFCPFQ